MNLSESDVTWQAGALGEIARVHFPNQYGISILKGTHFKSNGIDTYEVAVLWGTPWQWHLTFGTSITDSTLGHLSWEHVCAVAERVSALPRGMTDANAWAEAGGPMCSGGD